jgi:hypothetical protein
MKLGLPDGERKDNGFVFLIVVEASSIDVHYGVGLGLPALTAHELTTLDRTAEETYRSTHSLDQALLGLVQGFDQLARSKYAPLNTPTQTPVAIKLPPVPPGPLGVLYVGGLLCVGILLLLVVLWLLTQMVKWGIFFPPSSSGYGGRDSPFGGNRGSSSGGSRGGWSSRGGSGSGRSGRGN